MEQSTKVIKSVQRSVDEFETSASVPKQLINNFFLKINIDELKKQFPKSNQKGTINISYQYICDIFDLYDAYHSYNILHSRISENLHNSICDLVQYGDSINNTISNQAQSIESLSEEVKRLKQEKEDEIKQLEQNMLKEKEQEKEQLMSQFSLLQKAYNSINPTTKSEQKLKEQLKTLLEENKNLSKNNFCILKDKNMINKANIRLNAKNVELVKIIDDLKIKISEHQKEICSKENIIKSQDKIIKLKEKNIDEKNKMIEQREKLIKDLGTKIHTSSISNVQNQQNSNEISNLNQKFLKLQKIKKQNEIEISKLEEKNQILKQKISDKDFLISKLNQEKQEFQQKNAKSSPEILQSTQENKSSKKEIRALKHSISKNESNISNLSQNNNQIQKNSEISELKQDDQIHQQKNQETENQLNENISSSETEIGISEITVIINDCKDNIEKIQNDIETIRKNFDESLIKLIELYFNLLSEKNELQSKLSEKKETSVQQEKRQIEILDGETIDKLRTIREINSGSFGRVYEVAKEVIYALKVLNKKVTHKEIRRFLNEYEIMNMLSHPNIIKTYGIMLNDDKHYPSILLEFCPNNLEEMIKKKIFSKVDIAFTIYQIAEAMKYVHFRHIIHRDLKPSNILVSFDNTIKISDFGISKFLTPEEQSSMTSGLGTHKYMAPEVIDEDNNYDEKVDVYSFGVLTFFILTCGELPAIKMSDKMKGKKAPIPSNFTNFSREMINKCWSFNSKERPSFKEIVEMMEINDFELIELTETEEYEVKNKIKQHKTKIPQY